MRKSIALFLLAFTAFGVFGQTSETQKRNSFVNSARTYLGTPYVYGGVTRSGIDCSGFVLCAYRDAGLGSLPHSAQLIHDASKRIPKSSLSRGDLIFFTENGGRSISHVAIWLGDDNQFIHAASGGTKTGVIISKLQGENYWTKHYWDAGRMIGTGTSPVNVPGSTSSSYASAPRTSSGSSSSSSQVVRRRTSTSSSGSSTSPMFNRRKRAKKEWPIAIELDGTFDWTFMDLDNKTGDKEVSYGFEAVGLGASFQFRSNLFVVDPGLMIRFDLDAKQDLLELPICVAANMKYGAVYGGISIPVEKHNGKMDFEEAFRFDENSSIDLIGGVQLHTPAIKFGRAEFSLLQDISFTVYGRDSDLQLSTAELFADGLKFKTGVKFALH